MTLYIAYEPFSRIRYKICNAWSIIYLANVSVSHNLVGDETFVYVCVLNFFPNPSLITANLCYSYIFVGSYFSR